MIVTHFFLKFLSVFFQTCPCKFEITQHVSKKLLIKNRYTCNTSMARQESRLRESFKRITFTPTSELASETLWTCDKFKLPWNQGCFQNNAQNCFFLIQDKINLDFEVKNSWVAMKSKLFSKCARIPLLYLLLAYF